MVTLRSTGVGLELRGRSVDVFSKHRSHCGASTMEGRLCLSAEEVTRVCGVITWRQLLSDLCPSGALGFGPSHENLDFCSAICEGEGLQLTASKVSSSSELVSCKCLCPYVDSCVKDTEMQETHCSCSL